MNAWLNYVGVGCVALSALACGSKGDEDDGADTGGASSGGTSSGGTSSGGTSSGGTAGTGGLNPPTTTMDFTDAASTCPNPPAVNMADCWKLVDSSAMTATDASPREDITYQHTTEDGNPDPGAFEATIPYTTASQWVSFGINFATVDMTNRAISARIKIASGLGVGTDEAPAGGTKVYAKSGMGYCYANGDYTSLGDTAHPGGEWYTIQFNLSRPPGYQDPACTFDPSDIRELGIQFDSGSANTAPETAVVLVDDVKY
ncbi:MAG TPA: hypothetical protein VMS65_04795 [Polyangiaceae bacterium]|nr:hypothetical protein [Polyangiaceae bacterium]